MNKIIDQEVVNVSEFCEADQENILEAVTFTSKVRDIRRASFKMCKKLSELNFEEGVEKIGEAAFFGCEAVKEVRFPESLKELGSQAFRRCSALEKVQISDALLLAMPEDVFTACPCEAALNARRLALAAEQKKETERLRVLQYNKFFNELYGSVMVGKNLDYTENYKAACESFAKAGGITADNGEVLKRLFQVEDNHIASVGRGCMDVQFANYNEKHAGSLTWEALDKEALAAIATSVKGIAEINEDTLRELDELWARFKDVIGHLNLRQVFARMIAALRPDLTVPVVHPGATNELYGWFKANGFVLEDARLGHGERAWLRNWFVQNNQIKQFLLTCIGKGDYEIGPFVWYFVEAFREGDQARTIVVDRQKLIRKLIAASGYSAPEGWSDEEDE